jgi:hypothetical protein
MRFMGREFQALKEKENAYYELTTVLEESDRFFLELWDIIPDLVRDDIIGMI